MKKESTEERAGMLTVTGVAQKGERGEPLKAGEAETARSDDLELRRGRKEGDVQGRGLGLDLGLGLGLHWEARTRRKKGKKELDDWSK